MFASGQPHNIIELLSLCRTCDLIGAIWCILSGNAKLAAVESEKEITVADQHNEKQETARNLNDDQIITERKHPRRAFLGVAGALLAGGAAALVSGLNAEAQDAPPAKKESDPDTKKKSSKSGKTKKGKTAKKKESDPDDKK